MRIETARLAEIALPLRRPFVLSGGALSVRRSLIVELTSEDGVVGYGESAPFELPFYSEETIDSARSMLANVLLPRILSREVDHPEDLHRLLTDGICGNHFARAGAETAWWDLAARSIGKSVADLVTDRLAEMGVREADRTPGRTAECGVAIGIPPDGAGDSLAADVGAAIRAGYRRVKLKVRPGWSAEPIQQALEVMREENRILPLWVDGNGGFDAERDRDELLNLKRDELLFIEQPFPAASLVDLRTFERDSGIRICLDETLVSDSVARQVIEMGGPMIWNLKVQRLGGLEETCRVYARGLAAGAQMWVGTMPESGLGAQSALIFAALAPMAWPTDVEPSDRWYDPGTDIVNLEMDSNGLMCRADDIALDLTTALKVWSSLQA